MKEVYGDVNIGTHPTAEETIGTFNQEAELDEEPRTCPSNINENFTNSHGDVGVYSPQPDVTPELLD